MIDFKNIDINKLNDTDLLYLIQNFEDKDNDYVSIIKMLPAAVNYNASRIREVLQLLKDDRKLIVVYPGIDDIDTSNLEYVGDVYDGNMYLKSCS